MACPAGLVMPERRGAQAPLNTECRAPHSKGVGATQRGLAFQRTKTQGDTRMGLGHQEDVPPGSSRDTPSAGTTSFSGRVLAGLMWTLASTRTAETQQPHGLLVSSSQDSGWAVGRDGQTSIEHGLGGRPGEAPTFCVMAPKEPRTQRWANPMLSADMHISGKDLRSRGCHGHTDSTQEFQPGHRAQ